MAKNFKIRDATCGCTGSRSCLMCESYRTDKFIALAKHPLPESKHKSFEFCSECGSKAWSGWPHHADHHPENEGDWIVITGIHLIEEAISEQEEQDIVAHIDAHEWVNSQSGRRKQDYGPRVNFKKKKLNLEGFHGLPVYFRSVWERIRVSVPVLSDFLPIELCNLEYDEERGSSIEPHFDDFWVWGERLVTLNYLSDTTLTLTYPQGTSGAEEAAVAMETTEMHDDDDSVRDVQVQIRMKRRSLLVLSADARCKWLHGIQRKDIRGRRVATTWRELAPEFLPGGEGYERVGREIVRLGSQYI